MIKTILKWILIVFLALDLGYLHLRMSLVEQQLDIIWCILYPKPPICKLMGDRHERQTPTATHPKEDKITI